jgi:hypothetical protein
MMPEKNLVLSALSSIFEMVTLSWGDTDVTVPVWVAWRIRVASLANKTVRTRAMNAGGQPEPWRLSLVAAETIESVTQMMQLASLMPEGVGAETRATISKNLAADIDGDWCGTPPRWKWPFPPHKLGDIESFDPVDYLISAVLFHQAAETVNDAQLARDFAGVADRLLERGMAGR